MSREWYVLQGEKQRGPYSRAELQVLAGNRTLNPGARVRKGTDGPWRPASNVSGLFPWIEEARSAEVEPVPVEEAGAGAPSHRWKLAVAVGATAILSTTVAVVACVLLLGGRDDPAAADGGVAVAEDERARVISKVGAGEAFELPVIVEPEIMEPEPPVEPAVAADDGPADIVVGDTADTAPEVDVKDVAPEPLVADVPETPQLDPKPLLPPIPDVKTEITDAEIREFERSVRLEFRASDALARYEVFSRSFTFTDDQQEGVDAELAEWQQRSDEDLYRLGADWVTLEEVRAAEEEAEELIARALALVEVGNFDLCIENLEDANRANPNGIKAPYLLGLIWSLPFAGLNGPDNAERYFRTVLLRQPNHAGALNSIAIAQIKQGHHGPALTNLERAAELSEACPEVIQNLGRFIFLAGIDRVRTRDSIVDRYGELYARLLAEQKGPAAQESVGWLHMVPIFPESERMEEPETPVTVAAGGTRLEAVATGSGFVVAPHYVLTNRHVVYPEEQGYGLADAIGAADPANPENELRGKIIAISDTADLALLYFGELESPPLPLRREDVDLATEVMILGYPRGDVFGTGLKATQGIVSALPDQTRREGSDSYLFDATTDAGNSGGPVLDADGQVVALLTFVYGIQARVAAGLEADFTGGVPSTLAAEFAEQNIPRFGELPQAPPVGGSWADVTQAASPSVLRLTVYYEAGVAEFQPKQQLAGVQPNVYEDATCPTCNGRTRLACPRRGCVRGQISVRYYETAVVGVGPNRAVIRVPKFRDETCPVCTGASSLDCPDCVAGYDSYLR